MSNAQERRRRRHAFSPEVRAKLKNLTSLDNWHGPLAATMDIAIIWIAIYITTQSVWFYLLSAILIGTRQRAFATLLHEASHYTLCANRKLNNAIGTVAGWSVFQSFYRYRSSHGGEHHRYLGDVKRDPDTLNYKNQGLFDVEPKSFVQKHLIPLVFGLKTAENLKNLVRDRLLPKKWSTTSRQEKFEYTMFVLFWLSVLGLTWKYNLTYYVFWFWIVPYLTVFQAVNWLIELAEHFPLILLFDTEIEMTRNRRGDRIENFFFGMHGENWHLVHHLYPGIPFWNLVKAHRVMMADPVYAAANFRNGGLMMEGPDGEPSIVSMLENQLSRARQSTSITA